MKKNFETFKIYRTILAALEVVFLMACSLQGTPGKPYSSENGKPPETALMHTRYNAEPSPNTDPNTADNAEPSPETKKTTDTKDNLVQRSNKLKRPEKVIIDAPVVCQMPELRDGCEVSSLAMLLQYAGVKVDKMTLASKVKKDRTPLKIDKSGDIIKWGNPHEGFVGDITGKRKGFAVYHKPLLELLEQYLPGRGVDLTGRPFDEILDSVAQKKPVVLWATIDFKPPSSYEKWRHDGQIIKVTFDEHAVLLVGYDDEYCYVNNPYNGQKKQKVKKSDLIKAWKSIGSQAITYK